MTKRKSGDSDTLIETHGFSFRTMPGHVNIDRSVSSGQTGASASGQRWAASMQAGALYLQDLAGGIYAGVKGEGKPEVQTPSDILTIPPIDAKRVLPQGKPRMARGIEGTKEQMEPVPSMRAERSKINGLFLNMAERFRFKDTNNGANPSSKPKNSSMRSGRCGYVLDADKWLWQAHQIVHVATDGSAPSFRCANVGTCCYLKQLSSHKQ
ncbi:hypothetical protein MJT46_017664 [Ovis ammon polii x Ovis aries]|nr:hypothetical protein MJT46_017664 [Ovis ammon polii x Ovis aries]